MSFPRNDPTNDAPRGARQDGKGPGHAARRGAEGPGPAGRRRGKRAPWRKPSARSGLDEGAFSNEPPRSPQAAWLPNDHEDVVRWAKAS